jgi:signal transduction histidine kinase
VNVCVTDRSVRKLLIEANLIEASSNHGERRFLSSSQDPLNPPYPLPEETAQAAASPATPAQPSDLLRETPARKAIRVLLAEDSPLDVELTREYLSESDQFHFTLEDVNSFAGILERLETAKFELLLLDLSVLQGRDLRESIETFQRIATIPVVVLTGFDNEAFGVEAVKSGAQDYLVKGRISGDILIRSVRYALERHHRQNLEERLNQAQRLEEIGRLAGGIAHDFNNILTAIMGYVELMREMDPTEDEWPHYLEAVSTSAERAAALTQQLLAFARKQIIRPRALNLNDSVSKIEPMLRRLISENIELSTRLARDLWSTNADPSQIDQIIVNLVVNARDALTEGGRITLETANLNLDDREARLLELPAGEYVAFTVEDNGQGMNDAVKARIFEPFFTTKDVGEGVGLGLATCYGIVRQNRGAITVDSAPGQGATFRIYFPRLQNAGYEPGIVRANETLKSEGETILLVEDEAVVRDVAVQTLRQFGYRVLKAAHGVEALRVAEAHNGPIDLLLTDLIMPQMGGRELADRLLAIYPTLQVLFISGYTDDPLVRDRIREQGYTFLQKPFTPRVLAQQVRKALTTYRKRGSGIN